MPERKLEKGIRERILRTMIEMRAPVALRSLRINAGEEKKATRQLIYYHLRKMVKDGVIMETTDKDVEKTYFCREAFYDPSVIEAYSIHMRALISLIKEDIRNISPETINRVVALLKASVLPYTTYK